MKKQAQLPRKSSRKGGKRKPYLLLTSSSCWAVLFLPPLKTGYRGHPGCGPKGGQGEPGMLCGCGGRGQGGPGGHGLLGHRGKAGRRQQGGASYLLGIVASPRFHFMREGEILRHTKPAACRSG